MRGRGADDEPGERIRSIRGPLGGLYCFIEVAQGKPSPEESRTPKPARRRVHEKVSLKESRTPSGVPACLVLLSRNRYFGRCERTMACNLESGIDGYLFCWRSLCR